MTRTPIEPAPAIFTDLYELTMAQAYLAEGMVDPAVFSLAVRRLPAERNFLLACGLGTLLDDLESLRFTPDELRYLESLGRFTPDFLDWLERFRFTGTVHAVAEGTPVFAEEPLVEIEAPLPEAQLIETLVLNRIHLQTLIASKGVRVVLAAQGRRVVDFGARRMHGIEAALAGARAFHIAGIDATSNMLAGQRLGVPVAGTMAHSYIQAHDDETTAFAAFAALYPDTVLLVDTYDTPRGVERVIELARRLGPDFRVSAVRLDSGDLGALAVDARRRLDAAGLERVQIFASGGLDEHAIASLVAAAAPIDGFGVGTAMGVVRDRPDLDIAYKLCAYAGRGRLKTSTGKPVLPGRKQVFRTIEQGRASGDVIARAEETLPGRPLLAPVMRGGRRLPDLALDLAGARERARREIALLPPALTGLSAAQPPYPVALSPALASYRDRVVAAVGGR